MKVTAVIVAAGRGNRMGADRPKQFLLLGDRPVLAHTLAAFEGSRVDEVIVVTSAEDIDTVRHDIVDAYGYKKVAAVIRGGSERYDSCFEGIRHAMKDEARQADRILIHDGARALVTPDEIDRVIDALDSHDAVCPGVPVKDTLRVVGGEGIAEAVADRARLRSIQTPQGFDAHKLYKAYLDFYRMTSGSDQRRHITDDAMVAELYGNMSVFICPGSYSNIKLTTPDDLIIAEAILSSRSN